ncbi:MAG TPA: TIGR03936 family radical SAM-associated protein [Acidimicrobiales bacterium]
MRVRVRFAKQGKVRWTSHRDVARMWERALRRAELPVAYSEGFSPRPRVSFGLALSTGHESLAEYLDVDLTSDDVDFCTLPELLTPCLPVGITAQVAALTGLRDPSLQQDVTSCTWEIEVVGLAPAEAADAVDRVLESSTLMVTRSRKGTESTDDIRPAIGALAVLGATEVGTLLRAELATQPRSLRPGELIAAVAPGHDEGRVLRTHQWIERDGARREPIPLLATDAPHTESVCA